MDAGTHIHEASEGPCARGSTVAVAKGERVEKVEIRVRGRVQGGGFPPFAWMLARDLGLAGAALNDAEGVLIRVAGADPANRRYHAQPIACHACGPQEKPVWLGDPDKGFDQRSVPDAVGQAAIAAATLLDEAK